MWGILFSCLTFIFEGLCYYYFFSSRSVKKRISFPLDSSPAEQCTYETPGTEATLWHMQLVSDPVHRDASLLCPWLPLPLSDSDGVSNKQSLSPATSAQFKTTGIVGHAFVYRYGEVSMEPLAFPTCFIVPCLFFLPTFPLLNPLSTISLSFYCECFKKISQRNNTFCDQQSLKLQKCDGKKAIGCLVFVI